MNYKTLGQNTLDGSLMGLLTHVNTFNDLSEVPLAATWGKRYAMGERDDVFRYGNPYRCEEVSDHFGKFAKVENPEVREHRSITISRAYWADDRRCPRVGQGSEVAVSTPTVRGASWSTARSGSTASPGSSTGRSSRPRARSSCSRPTATRMSTGAPRRRSITWHSRDLHEIEVIVIPPDEYARMEPGVEYTLDAPERGAGLRVEDQRAGDDHEKADERAFRLGSGYSKMCAAAPSKPGAAPVLLVLHERLVRGNRHPVACLVLGMPTMSQHMRHPNLVHA